MEVTDETRVNTLIELIKEDRAEMRDIKKNVYSTMQLFVIASVVITAYGFDHRDPLKQPLPSAYLLAADIIFMFISVAFFFLRKRDLVSVRKDLIKRQSQLTTLLQHNYFKGSNDVKVDIKEIDLNPEIIIASIIYVTLIVFTILIMKKL
jgi:hypothetical protein